MSVSVSSTVPFSAPKQPNASPEKSVPLVLSYVTNVSGQCTMGTRWNDSV